MNDNISNVNRIANNTLCMFIRFLLVVIIGLYISRIVLATLGVEDFGIYNVVGSVVIFLSFFKNALSSSTYRYLAYELSSGNALNLKRLFAMAINVHLLLALMLFILLELGGVWFLNNHLNISPERLYAANWCFQFSLFCFIIEIIKMPYHSLIVVHEHMNFYTYLSVIEISMKLGVVFLLQIVSLDRLILYSLLLFGVALITFICYYCY
jgi:O-antigen/teichoic acid export membrane protein